jgi:hypothetical protein
MATSSKEVLAGHVKALLDVVDGKIAPLEGIAMDPDARFRTRTVEDDTRLAEEPGSRMDHESWWLTVGDDVIPFWNAPHMGRGGSMAYVSSGERSAKGRVVCEGVGFGTIRRKFNPTRGRHTGLCFVRIPEDSDGKGRVVLNLWEITLADGNPCPYRTVAYPQPGVWTPVAVTGNLRGISCYSRRPVDYVLLELMVEGFEKEEKLEVADMAIYPWEEG